MVQRIKFEELESKFKQQCMDAPHLVIMEVYELGIQACENNNISKARNVIKTLIGSLNFEYAEAALGLYKLYNHCLGLLNNNRFEEAKLMLNELLQHWNKAIDINLSASENPKQDTDASEAISDLYSRGIIACEEKNEIKTTKVLRILMNALDFQYEEVASGFYRLYDHCLQLVNDKRFDEAKEILNELNQCWNKAVIGNLNEIAA